MQTDAFTMQPCHNFDRALKINASSSKALTTFGGECRLLLIVESRTSKIFSLK